jgi:hypothetical protein
MVTEGYTQEGPGASGQNLVQQSGVNSRMLGKLEKRKDFPFLILDFSFVIPLAEKWFRNEK